VQTGKVKQFPWSSSARLLGGLAEWLKERVAEKARSRRKT